MFPWDAKVKMVVVSRLTSGVCVLGGGEVVRKKCVPVREFAGHVSPSLLWRLLNGSCAPGAGSA